MKFREGHKDEVEHTPEEMAEIVSLMYEMIWWCALYGSSGEVGSVFSVDYYGQQDVTLATDSNLLEVLREAKKHWRYPKDFKPTACEGDEP